MSDQVNIWPKECDWPEPHPPHLWSGEENPYKVIYSHQVHSCTGSLQREKEHNE